MNATLTSVLHVTDTTWLLKILRASKFSQLKSREMVTNYMSLRNIMPEWLQDIDFTNPRNQAFFRTGYAIFVSNNYVYFSQTKFRKLLLSHNV